MRIQFNVNITPISEQERPPTGPLVPTGAAPAQLHQLAIGLEPNFMVYDGTISRAPVWSDKDWNFLPADKLDWGTEALPREIRTDAPDTDENYWAATQQCGWLALHADTYWPKTAQPIDRMLPIMLDLEAPSWSKRLPEPTKADPQAVESDEDFYDRTLGKLAGVIWNVGVGCGCNVMPNRSGNQERTRIGVYGWPDPWMLRNFTPDQVSGMHGWQAFLRRVDYFAPCLYLWANTISDDAWFDWADKVIRDCRRHAPWMPVMPVLCPLYLQLGSGDLYPDRCKLDSQPIPAMQWRRMLRFLKRRGCEAYIWTPPLATISVEMARLYDIAGEVA